MAAYQKDFIIFDLWRINRLDLSKTSIRNTGLCLRRYQDIHNLELSFRIKMKGASIKVFYKDEIICSVEDDTYKRGSIGLYSDEVWRGNAYTRVKIVTPD